MVPYQLKDSVTGESLRGGAVQLLLVPHCQLCEAQTQNHTNETLNSSPISKPNATQEQKGIYLLFRNLLSRFRNRKYVVSQKVGLVGLGGLMHSL